MLKRELKIEDSDIVYELFFTISLHTFDVVKMVSNVCHLVSYLKYLYFMGLRDILT